MSNKLIAREKPRDDQLSALAALAEEEFNSRYFRPPQFVVAAPGRVNLIGEHIDYSDGFVLPMAIDRYVVIAASCIRNTKTPAAAIYSCSLQQELKAKLNGAQIPAGDDWSSYITGVIAGFQDLQLDIPSFEAVVLSNVPLGGGLSSSAALEVATATLLEQLTGEALPPTQKALLCQPGGTPLRRRAVRHHGSVQRGIWPPESTDADRLRFACRDAHSVSGR